jgi:hypothetical protein
LLVALILSIDCARRSKVCLKKKDRNGNEQQQQKTKTSLPTSHAKPKKKLF